MEMGMIKKIVALVLVLLAGGGWFYMDYQNKQEQLAIAEMHKAMEQARAQAAARAAAVAKFQTQLQSDLTACQAVAESAKNDYVTKNQIPVKRKPGQFTIPPAVANEAAKILEDAKTACQQTYEARLKSGS